MPEHKYVIAGMSDNARDKPIPPAPQIEVIGGVTYLGGTVWPFSETRPLQIGYVGHKNSDTLIMTAICEGYNALNGYARVPLEGHPWPGLYSNYDDLPVVVHGGLTYGPEDRSEPLEWELEGKSGKFPGRPGRSWTDIGGWIGFDTAHAFDHWSDEAIFEAFASTGKTPSERFVRNRKVMSEIEGNYSRPMSEMDLEWTLDMLSRETDLLAKQVLVAQMEAE
jgi:hypothetical protein